MAPSPFLNSYFIFIENKKQYSVKIALLGIGMVGKSSLAYRFINYNAPEDHDPTIEDKFMTEVTIDKQSITVNILDTAGQDDYQGLLDTWIDYGDGFLLVFALNDKSSFIALDKRKQKIDLIKKKTKCPIILVGNKSDLQDERKVTRKEAEDKAKAWGATYVETSAFKDENYKEAFTECTKKILDILYPKNEIKVQDKSCCVIY